MSGDAMEMLRPWHDFYMLAGAASATLVGLVFIAISIGSDYFNDQTTTGLNTFITPTIVHFGGVLLVCLLAVVPGHSYLSLGAMLGVGCFFGLCYAGYIAQRILSRRFPGVETVDRVWYAVTPILAYLLLIAAAVLLACRHPTGIPLMAVSLVILMLAGIRNAWDMMVWIVVKTTPRN
jgi:hypothetical protein